MRAISDKLSVTAPFIYYHFATKQDLYYACLQRGLIELEKTSKEASAEGTVVDRFTALIASIGKWQMGNPGDGSALLSNAGTNSAPNRHVSADQRKQLLSVQQRYFNRLKNVIDEGQAAGVFEVLDSTVTTFAILAIGDHVPRWYRVGGRLNIDEIVSINVGLALRLVGFKLANKAGGSSKTTSRKKRT